MADINNKNLQNTGDPEQAFQPDDDLYNKKITPIPKPAQNIGVDLNDTLYQNIINSGMASSVDISKINAFTNIAKTRDDLYRLLDIMGDDSAIAAVLEVYTEDATETADSGRIVWATSNNADAAEYVTYLLNSMNVDKNIYKWVYALCKYGDVYLRLYRESDYKDLIFDNEEAEKIKLLESLTTEDNRNALGKEPLKEDVNIKAYHKNDHYVPYLEMVDNPAEMFELTRFGKTAGYIQAEITPNQTGGKTNAMLDYFRYQFRRNDINIYQPTEFVHASLEDNTSRLPEEVELFVDNEADLTNKNAIRMAYKVKRGQSLLYTVFKIWRQLMLLETSVMLNRLTKSSILRIINVEVGDSPQEMVGPKLHAIKQLLEQKSAIDAGVSMNEYTNPGPVENNVYLATRNGIGNVDIKPVGGDIDVKGLADLEYYRDKLYGALKVPKQFMGFTDDGAGFNGGQSLSIISSRYAKTIKRIQNTILQALTDAINLMLLNRGLLNYINEFELRMQPPTTQEEIDRRENASGKIQLIRDIMDIATDVTDPIIRLKMFKSMLSNVISETEVIELLEEMIDKTEEELQDEEEPETETETQDDEFNSDEPLGVDLHNPSPSSFENPEKEKDTSNETEMDSNEDETSDTDALPTPDKLASEHNLGDFSDMTNPNFSVQ